MSWRKTPAGPTAILEMAETAGLWRLTATERSPLLATTRGVGMQIAHAISEHAVARIILGIGGRPDISAASVTCSR